MYIVFIQDVPDFDLHFEKAYKWLASNVAEKNSFIASLWKVSEEEIVKIHSTFIQPVPCAQI